MKIEIKKVEYDFTIGLGALRQLEKNTGKGITQFDDISPVELFPQVAHATLMARNKDYSLTLDELIYEMDSTPEILDLTIDAFLRYMDDWGKTQGKKKVGQKR